MSNWLTQQPKQIVNGALAICSTAGALPMLPLLLWICPLLYHLLQHVVDLPDSPTFPQRKLPSIHARYRTVAWGKKHLPVASYFAKIMEATKHISRVYIIRHVTLGRLASIENVYMNYW